ncbi:SIR2 family protein [Roseivivax marinus]|uniref:SIR2 family protein n=1 Tax=Roseivivax marinus TaxID=1379903 RepID=UPI00273CFDCF|nr:SIR2 family protein [Roseivivax marinus]
MVTVARRGERPLEPDEFELHVAQAVGLENVGALLGAGASLSCGGMSMKQLWTEFSADNPDAVEWLRSSGYLSKTTETPENIEVLIDRVAVGLMDAKRRGAVTDDIIKARNGLLQAVLRAAILEQGWLEDPATASGDDRLSDHVRFLTRLAYTRNPGQPAPWVFTTNYDMAIELAAESAGLHVQDGFRGFHQRLFTPSAFDLGLRNTEARGEAQFGTYEVYLAKLHGSLSWRSAPDGAVEAVQIPYASAEVTKFLNGDLDDPSSLLVFPSSAKFVDTVGFVYGELMRRLTQFLAKPNVCMLVSGYGFGDNHLNRILLSALNNPTLQLIVYLPEIAGFENDGSPSNAAELTESLKGFLKLKLPQITVIGGGSEAYFDRLTKHLPDPTVIDDPADRARKLAVAFRDILGAGETN